jgi:hypothetical protein
MKTLIYQVYVGKQSNLYDYCTNSVTEYAKSINADYICQREPILKIRPGSNNNRSKEAVERLGYLPIYEKENAFDYFSKGYDRIAIIDSDIFIRPNSPNIFVEIEDCEFGAVAEREMPLTQAYQNKIKNYSAMQYHGLAQKINFKLNNLGYEFFNMGMIVMDKSISKRFKSAKEFLSRPIWQPFIDGVGAWKWSTDQTLLNTWLKIENIKVKHLHWKWNGLYSVNTKLNECHFIHFFLKDKLPNKGENVKDLMKKIC